jgi:CBS domain-containing protein
MPRTPSAGSGVPGQQLTDRVRSVWNDLPPVWLWRAGALVSLVLALLFAGVALISTAWWGALAFVLLAATVVCLVRSEPDEPESAPRPARPAARQAPSVPVADTSPRRADLRVGDVMTPRPAALPSTAPVRAAARAMRDLDVGALIVVEDDRTLGIVTDRDIVVRALATEDETATLGEICSRDLATVPAESSAADALQVMEARSVRRLPVTARGSVVGIVSMGDLVTAAPPH